MKKSPMMHQLILIGVAVIASCAMNISVNEALCGNCFHGEDCEDYGNNHVPRFVQKSAKVVLTKQSSNTAVYQAKAYDRDLRSCRDKLEPCPCAELIYFIVEDESESMRIDEKTGDLAVDIDLVDDNEFDVILGVRNSGEEDYSTMTLTFIAVGLDGLQKEQGSKMVSDLKAADETRVPGRGNDNRKTNNGEKYDSPLEKPKSRRKRSAVSPPVANVEFSVSPGDNNSMIAVGDIKHISVQITFPPNGTVVNAIEVFVMDNDTALLAVGDVSVSSIGSCLTLDPNLTLSEVNDNATRIKSNETSVTENHFLYEEVDLNLGTVFNDPDCADSSDTASVSITIQYDIVRVIHDGSEEHNNTEAIVAFGIEYADSTRVWIVSHSYTIMDDNDYNATERLNTNRYTSYNVTFSSVVRLGAPAFFDVDIFVPHKYVDLTIEAFAPFNTTGLSDPIMEDSVSVCGVSLIGMGENYKFFDTSAVSNTKLASESGLTDIQDSLTLGRILNAGSDFESSDTDEGDRISVRVMLDLSDERYSSLTADDELWFGISARYGNSQIWLANLATNISEPEPDNLNETAILDVIPTFTHNLRTPEIGPDDVLVYDVVMNAPPATINTYVAEALSTINVSDPSPLDLKVCGVRLVEAMENYPCGFTEKSRATYGRSDQGFTDQLSIDYGYILNSGVNSDASANELKFEVYYEIQDDSLQHVTSDSTSSVTAGINMDMDVIWVGQKSVNLTNERTINASYTTDLPTEELTVIQFKETMISVDQGQWFGVDVDVYYYPGLKFVDQIFTMGSSDNNGISELEFCGIEFISAGDNVPCVDSSDIKDINITTISSADYNDYGTATLSSVTNVGRTSTTAYEEDPNNRVSVRMLYKLRTDNVPEYFNDTYAYMSLALTENQKWVGVIPIMGNSTIEYNATQEPQVKLPETPVLMAGQMFPLTVTLIPPVNVPANYQLKFTTSEANISTCGVKIVRVGKNFPCGLQAANITLGDSDAIIDLGIVASYDYRTSQDENITANADYSIDVEFYILELSGKARSSLVAYNIEVSYLGPPDIHPGDINYTDPVYQSTNGTGIYPEFYRVELGNNSEPSNSTEFMSGELLRLVMNLKLDASFSTSTISVHFIAPQLHQHDWDILSVSMLDDAMYSVGFPCMKTLPDEFTEHTTTDNLRGGPAFTPEIALNLGVVCLFPPDDAVQTEYELKFEAYARMRRTSDCDGDTTLGIGVNVNNMEIYATVNNYTRVMDQPAYEGITPISSPSDVQSFAAVTYPQNADLNTLIDIEFDIHLPLRVGTTYIEVFARQSLAGGSYVVKKLEIIDSSCGSGGLFGADLDNPEIPMEITQTFPETLQPRAVKFDVGAISHTGLNTSSGSSQVMFRLQVLAVDTVHASDQTLELEVRYNDNITHTENVTIDLLRTDADQPVLTVEAHTDCPANPASPVTNGDQFQITYNIKHDNTSTAVASSLKVVTFLPPLFKFNAISQVTIGGNASNSADVQVINSKAAAFVIQNISMFEEISVTLTLDVISLNRTIATRNVSIPWRASYSYLNQAPSNPYLGTKGKLSDLMCSAQLSHTDAAVCVSDNDISAGVDPSQITAAPIASGYNVGNIHPPNFMLFGSREPYDAYDPQRYILVDFISLHYITGVTATSDPSQQLSFRVLASRDGLGWSAIPATYNVSSGTRISVNKRASHIRIHFLSPSILNVSVSVFGCELESSTRVIKPKNAGYELAPRQFLVTNTSLFVCDSKPEINHRSACSVRDSSSGQWRVMDNRLQNLLGYDSSNGYTLSMSKTGKHMMSRNGGDKWSSISPKHFSTFNLDVEPKSVPWDTENPPTLQQLSPDTSHEFKGDNAGVHKKDGGTWNQVSDWLTV